MQKKHYPSDFVYYLSNDEMAPEEFREAIEGLPDEPTDVDEFTFDRLYVLEKVG